MADRAYIEDRAWQDVGGNVDAMVRLRDNGDGTYSVAVYDMATQNTATNLSGSGTTVVKSGSGVLVAIVFNKCVLSSVVTIYDNTAASGTKIGTITMPAVTLLANQLQLPYSCAFTNGLTVVKSTTDDITVIWR